MSCVRDCDICHGWNPWHHPYTVHAAWCAKYMTDETVEARTKNAKYNNAGGFYMLGYPEDGLRV